MARSIILRFAATCVDCGRSLSAGSTARWFGRGRVSCCGSPEALGERNDIVPLPLPNHVQPPASVLDADLELALSVGLSQAQAQRLAIAAPNVNLIVRLASGARFLTTAEHVVHLCACIAESCRDKVRDVMKATGG